MKISEIEIGDRHRKDLGDLEPLAKSIEEVGLLHPPAVNKKDVLIDGYRRIEACKMLGWEEIPVNRVDLENLVRGEHDANVFRKDFTPSEAVAIGKELEPELKRKAQERMKSGKPSSNFDKGRTDEKIGEIVGMSRETYRKARTVVDASEEDPDNFRKIKEQMDDRKISIDKAHRQVRRTKSKEKREKKAKEMPKPPALNRGELPLNEVICGDCIEVMNQLPENSIHMVMFSPGYWGLRDYGMDSVVWGGDPNCDHEWISKEVHHDNLRFRDPNDTASVGTDKNPEVYSEPDQEHPFCQKCGAWRGQLGLEPDYRMYIQNLVEVGRAIKRVLRPDGSWYLNLGDTYAGSGMGWGKKEGHYVNFEKVSEEILSNFPEGKPPHYETDIRAKCKMLMPHRVALALIDDGWICRNDIIWHKPNPMPSSVKDRLNVTNEFVFHFVQQGDYWYDLDAIREEPKTEWDPSFNRRVRDAKRGYTEDKASKGIIGVKATEREMKKYDDKGRLKRGYKTKEGEPHSQISGQEQHHGKDIDYSLKGKNPGDFWEITTQPFPKAHFAVYPEELCLKPIKSSCPPKVCARCGSPYERVTERVKGEVTEAMRRAGSDSEGEYYGTETKDYESSMAQKPSESKRRILQSMRQNVRTVGWRKTCGCETDETKPGIVLDPMAGSGTTGLVAEKLGRDFVLIELNPDYVEMTEERIFK